MFFLLIAIGVISFLAHLYANSNKSKPETAALAELDLRTKPVATNEFDEAIVWAACVLDDDPILDIQLHYLTSSKKSGWDTKKWVFDALALNAPPQPAPPTRRNPHPNREQHQTILD